MPPRRRRPRPRPTQEGNERVRVEHDNVSTPTRQPRPHTIPRTIQPVQTGIVIPQNDIGSDPDQIVGFVRAAEEHGFEYLVPYDHVLGADASSRPDWTG